MAISRERKEEQVAQLVEEASRALLTVLSDYRGLTVAELEDLRQLLKEQEGRLRVIKNSLIKKAAEKSDTLKSLEADTLEGPTALTFGFNDETAVAQVLAKFAKAHPALEIKGGLMADGTFMAAEEVNRLAALPSKDQLRGQLVGTLAAPVASFVRVLNANLSGLVNVLNNYKTIRQPAD